MAFFRSAGKSCRGCVAAVGLALAVLAIPAGAELVDGLGAYKRGDYEAAAALLRPLAEEGDPRAQYVLGRMRFYGQAFKQDSSAAALWYRRSAEQGYAPAQLAFALALEGGWGVAREPERAVQWYRRAAMQGVPDAMWRLAYHYRRGIGAPRDLVEAWAWFDLLAAGGDGRAIAERDWLALVGLDEGGLEQAKARSQALGRELEAAVFVPQARSRSTLPEPAFRPAP